MDEEVLTVEIDTGEYQAPLDALVDVLETIQETVIRIGKEIHGALIQLQKELKKYQRQHQFNG